MKKIILLSGLLVFLFAGEDKYLMYVNKLVNYNFTLNNVEDKKAPFEIKISNKNNKIKKTLEKRVKIKLITIFDNKAKLKFSTYLGEQLIKTETKWVKRGDKVYGCKVTKLNSTNIVLKCKNKTLLKSLDKQIPGFKEKR